MTDLNSESFYQAKFLVSRYQEREGPPWEQLRTSAEQTTAVIRDVVESLIKHYDKIGDRELTILYQLCRDSDKISAEEKREQVRDLDIPQDAINQVTKNIDQSVGSVGAPMEKSKFLIGGESDHIDAQKDLYACFQKIVENYDSESELVETADELVGIDFFEAQSDLMSPILHYLAPTVFPVINQQSKQSVDLLFSENVSVDLNEYLDERDLYLRLRDQFDLDSHFRDLDHFLHWIQFSDNEWTRENINRNVWQVQPGYKKYSAPEELWPIWRDRSVISAGWIGEVDETSDELSGWTANFVKEMSVGDVVIAKGGVHDLLGLGVISKENYEYVGGTDKEIPVDRSDKSKVHESIRHVDWIFTRDYSNPIHIEEWDMSKRFGNGWIEGYYNFQEFRWNLYEKHHDEVLSNLRKLEIKSRAYAEGDLPTDNPLLPFEKPNKRRRDEIIRQLHAKNQVIFYGPPGTGKTHIASEFAKWWVTEQTDGTPEAMQVQSVTFHPAFAYEDFLEGLEADATDNGAVDYDIEDGILKRIARQARQAKDAVDGNPPPYVLIIDEINRGNLAQIFGETITLLEADKRDSHTTQLAHSDDEFSIPSNLYIIGTMNTADRSIALVDAALRRRFRFLHFPPDYGVLLDKHDFADWTALDTAITDATNPFRTLLALSIRGLQHINDQIVDVPDLSKGQQIGHSYLYDVETSQEILDAWRFDILPLLEEYYFGQFDRIRRQLFSGAGDEVINWDAERIRPFTEEDLATFLGQFVDTDVSYTPATSTTDGGSNPTQSGTPTYPELLSEVHEEVFDQVGELLEVNSAEETNYNSDLERTTLALQSHHPEHPSGGTLRYAFQPKTHLDDPRILIGVYATEEFRDAVDIDFEQILADSNLSDRFEYADKTYSTIEATWPVEMEVKDADTPDGQTLREAIGEQTLQEVIDAFEELIETIHPAVIGAETPTQ